MENTKVITQRGGTPEKAIEFIESQPKVVSEYKVIILHVGTNWLSRKEEWSLYRRKVNGFFSEYEYREALCRLNPPPAIGDAIRFRNTYQKLINLIRSLNGDAIILVSSIIPRWWDNDRRHGIRETYNKMLKAFNNQPNVFFIHSYRPFFDRNQNLKAHLFDKDGLHLSARGAVVLRTFLCEKIDKALKKLLK